MSSILFWGLNWGRNKKNKKETFRNVSEMISLGSRDGRKVLEQGFSSNKREMNDNELEEGEACSYQDVDTSIDPDVALSYIVSFLNLFIAFIIYLKAYILG